MGCSYDRRPFSALYVKGFRAFWLAQLLSLSGTWMHQTCQAWLVYELTRSAFYLGLTGAAFTVPILVFSLLAGLLADRYSKRRILLLTQAFSTLPPLLLGVLTLTGQVKLWQVVVLALCMGTLNALELPVRQSFLIELVGRTRLLNAVALQSAAFNTARMAGPVIGGIIISRFDVSLAFFLNSISFIPVVAVLRRLDLPEVLSMGHSGILGSLKEAVQFIYRRREVLYLLSVVFSFSLLGLPYIHFLPLFAEEVLHVGPKGLGMLMGCAGAGALSGALVLSYIGEIRDKRRYISYAAVVFPSALMLFFFSKSYPLSLFCLYVVGLSVVSLLANVNSTIQLTVRDNLRGRVMSIYSLVFLGTVPIGSLFLGLLSEWLPYLWILRAGAFICLVIGVRLLLR